MSCTSDNQDAECVRRTRMGDTYAFEELVVRYQGPVFNALRRMVRNEEDARELAQNAFMKAFVNLEKFDQEKRFFSWLYRIAMNDALNFIAASRPAEPLTESHRSAAPGPDENLEAAETRRDIDEGLSRLTPEYRAVLVMRHFLDCSYQEIAEILEVPEKTVKSRLFSARHELRDEMLARGYGRRRDAHAR